VILGDLADVVRSKNAGIHYITVDVMFADRETYEAVVAVDALTTAAVADAYGVPEADVGLFRYDTGNAIKVTIPRERPAGSPGDPDLYGAQQHAPVYHLEVPDVEDDPA